MVTDILYSMVTDMPDDLFDSIIRDYPADLHAGIMRYRFPNDRKSRLVGKEIVRVLFSRRGLSFGWQNWMLTARNKPFLKGGPKFNISHSGDVVAVAFSDDEIGIDVEEERGIEVSDMMECLHECEKEYLDKNGNDAGLFYNIWVRKEALLKAIGVGITEDLKNINVLQERINYRGEWFVQDIGLMEGYRSSICTRDKIHPIKVTRIKLHEAV